MTFFHGTTAANWEIIQKRGYLLNDRWVDKENGERQAISPCTYLAVDQEEAACYGPVVLQVEYQPGAIADADNYVEDCWQVRVYVPIPLANIQRIANVPKAKTNVG